jgi:DNA polymerase III epsilon subunit-like protein
MKIVKLTAENVKRLRAVEITPDDTVQIVTGRNAQGKTSVLDAIWLALCGGPVVDPFVIDKQTSRRRGSRKLIDTAAYFGVPIEDGAAHGAEADALAACRVAWMMCGRVDARMPDGKLRRLGGIDLEQLHRLQVEWKAEQAKSFIAYRQRQGQSVDGIRPEWPMVPFAVQAEAAA